MNKLSILNEIAELMGDNVADVLESEGCIRLELNDGKLYHITVARIDEHGNLIEDED